MWLTLAACTNRRGQVQKPPLTSSSRGYRIHLDELFRFVWQLHIELLIDSIEPHRFNSCLPAVRVCTWRCVLCSKFHRKHIRAIHIRCQVVVALAESLTRDGVLYIE
jgi:precorrin-6x reductase